MRLAALTGAVVRPPSFSLFPLGREAHGNEEEPLSEPGGEADLCGPRGGK